MDAVEEAAQILAPGRKTMAFTVAGISSESWIPTYRMAGGVWGKVDPVHSFLTLFPLNVQSLVERNLWVAQGLYKAVESIASLVDARPLSIRPEE